MKKVQHRAIIILSVALALLSFPVTAGAQQQTGADAEQLSKQIVALYKQGKIDDAITLAQRLVDIRRAALGEDHPDHVTALNVLGSLYKAQGAYDKAEPIFQLGLAIREKTLGPDHLDVATSLDYLARIYEAQGRFQKAEPLIRRGLEIRQKALGPDHSEVAASLNDLAEQYQAQGRYAEAEPLLQRSLAIREKVLGPNDPAVADILNRLALLCRAQGKYKEAEPLFKRALAIREKALEPDQPGIASIMNELADLYRLQGRYKEAAPLYQRSLDIREEALGPDHPAVAASMNNLALLYTEQGDYVAAESLLKSSLSILWDTVGFNHPAVATCFENLANIYKLQGRYEDAERLCRRSVEIREKSQGADPLDLAGSLNELAELYRVQGRYAEAEPLYKRSLAIKEKRLGPDHPDMATSLNNLALLYFEHGRYAEAEPLFKRSLAVNVKALGSDHPNVAKTLNNLAELYRAQGRYREAIPLYVDCLAIRIKVLGPDHLDVADSLNNLALLYSELGEYAEAESLLRRSLAISEKVLGPEHPAVATNLGNLAFLCSKQGKFAEAEQLYQRSLVIREKGLGPDLPEVAASLNNLAELYTRQGKYAAAEPLYLRSLTIWEKTLGPDHPVVGISLNNLAVLYDSQGQYGQAGTYFDRDLQFLARRFEYSFTYMSEQDRLQFLDTVSGRFPAYFSFCLRARDRVPGLAGKMYDVVLWEKGFIAQSVAALRAKIQVGGDAEALKLLERLAAKKTEIAKLATTPVESDPTKQAARRTRIEALEKEANDLEKELVKRPSALGEEKRLARVTWQQVRDSLQSGEAAVEVVHFRFFDGKKWTETSYYVALVIRRDSQEPAFIVLGEAKELEGVPLRDYRRLVAAPAAEERRPEGVGRRFYAAFWQPLEAALGGAKRVYVSSDGELNQVALGAVPGADGKLLMESYELRTINSTKDLLRGAGAPASGPAVLVGNPAFGASEAEQRAALQSAQPTNKEAQLAQAVPASGTKGPASLRSRDLRGGALTALPGTQEEVAEVAALLQPKGWPVQSYTGTGALEERVKAVRQPRVLHLATHGFFEADQAPRLEDRDALMGEPPAPTLEDPMLRSGVYLAGADRVLAGKAPAPDLDDGVLTAYEASQLNLQGTPLVVLSACGTGLGQTEAGEGVFGLRRGLQVAGAESVLMSMWPVPDQETRELMGLFYAKWLAGKSKPEALREAQLEERAKVQARYGADLPFFWGAFVLVGR